MLLYAIHPIIDPIFYTWYNLADVSLSKQMQTISFNSNSRKKPCLVFLKIYCILWEINLFLTVWSSRAIYYLWQEEECSINHWIWIMLALWSWMQKCCFTQKGSTVELHYGHWSNYTQRNSLDLCLGNQSYAVLCPACVPFTDFTVYSLQLWISDQCTNI